MSEENDTPEEEQPENGDEGSIEDEWAAALGEQKGEGEGEGEGDAAADWGDALSEQAAASAGEGAHEQAEKTDFDTLTPDADCVGSRSLDMVLDIPVTLSMEIGRTEIPIRHLLQLSQGSVVELDHMAGEPMDVLVNGTLIAHGEVVVVNERYGIRLTDVISPQERVKKLR